MSSQAKVEEVFRLVLGRPDLVLRPEMTTFDIEGWDSLAHLRILVEIQKQCGIKLEVAEVVRMRNVGDLIGLVDERLQAKESANRRATS